MPKETKTVCRTPSVITLCLQHCVELGGSVSTAKAVVCSLQYYQVEQMSEYLPSLHIKTLSALILYGLFALQVLQSAQGSVEQTQNPFIG